MSAMYKIIVDKMGRTERRLDGFSGKVSLKG